METYLRVIPRDLFNESKLLKCIGRLVLLIHEGNSNGIEFGHNGEPFIIHLQDDGSLFISNIHFSIGDSYLFFKTTYNSKANYPLFCEYDNCDILVFDESGNYEPEFIELLTTINA